MDLDTLYASLPAIQCQGKCVDSCGPIAAAAPEHARLERLTGQPLTYTEGFRCGYQDADGLCVGYEARPMICRLFGLTPRLQCKHGCEPEWWLSEDEARALLAAAGPAIHAQPDDRVPVMFYHFFPDAPAT